MVVMATPGRQEEVSQTGQNVCYVNEEPREQPIEQPVVQPRPRREPKRAGGYDCDFVQRPPKFQTDCSVCLLVLRSPHLATCCGHNFCKECVERVQKDGKGCPLCNAEQFTIAYNRAHDASLKDFDVYCTHRKVGCEWNGKLEMLDKHLNVNPKREKQLEGCAFVEVQCCHDGCGYSFQRRLIAQHQGEECDQRQFSCDYCHDYNSTWYDVVANHFPVCKCYPVPCPSYCTPYTIERQHLEHHLNEDCPLQEVECEFKYVGCETKLPRKDMPDHLKEYASHMTLLARQNQELTAKLLEKEETIKRMVEENQREMERVESLAACKQQSSETFVRQMHEAMDKKLGQLGRMVEENRREMEGIGRVIETQKKELKAKDERIENLAKQHHGDMDRMEQEKQKQLKQLEQEKNEQIKRLEKELRQRTKETEEGRVGLARLEGRFVELQKKTEADVSKVKGEIHNMETKRAQLVIETQRQITELERSKALAVEVRGLKDESKRIEDRVMMVERSVITKAEHEELAQQVVTKRELSKRVGELAQKQHTAKTDLHKQMKGLEQKQVATSSSLEKLRHHVQIAPVQIVITNFDQHKRDNDQWYSEGFYTHPQGYKMCLRVDANGYGDDKGSHVSCFIQLMPGEFDNHLKWPFRGNVVIQLLNQREDNNHPTVTVHFSDQTPAKSTARVTSGERSANGWGYGQFIPHSELSHNAAKNRQYLMNNCLYFRMKVELRCRN